MQEIFWWFERLNSKDLGNTLVLTLVTLVVGGIFSWAIISYDRVQAIADPFYLEATSNGLL